MAELTDLFAQARDADIEAVAGARLVRQGNRMRGPCPICSGRPKPASAAPRKRKGPSTAFSVDPRARLFKCFSCNEGGDVIVLEQLLRGGTRREAAERLVGGVILTSKPVERRPEPRRDEGSKSLSPAEKLGREIWAGASTSPIAATPAAAYLSARGIWGPVLGAIGNRLRFNPRAKWGWDPQAGEWLYAPAIVGRVVTPDGPTGGVHVTYLSADLKAKARLDPAKRMWGPQRGESGRPGCVWLSSPEGAGRLVVAEGIESALSAAMLLGGPCRVAAALSLGALQGGWLTDKWGRLDPGAVASDPEKPAFTWPEPEGAPWGEVVVAVDRDMGGIEVKTRKLGGGTVRRRLEGDERARICAGLAVQAWTRAGANAVRAIAPAAGRDFNDELRATA